MVNIKTLNKWQGIGISLIILFLIVILILFNPYQKSISIKVADDSSFMVTIKISQDYGKSILLSKKVIVKNGDTAIDALKNVADVTFNYGNEFVESINGIKSKFNSGFGEKKDWFYYINGILVNAGASQYFLHSGDVERWDFHSWDTDRVASAIIGDYPEPFLHGINGIQHDIIVVYSNFFYDDAFMIQQELKKQGCSVSLKNLDELTDDEKANSNLILIDTFNNEFISELNSNAKSIGWFVEFTENGLNSYSETGERNTFFDHGGVILACQNPWNLEGTWNSKYVVWTISGITEKDVKNAVDVLIENPSSINNCAGVILYENHVYKVP